MALNPRLELFRVHNDPRSIFAVVHTISLSFSPDPLIRWLRPMAPPWAKNEPETRKWQYRRVQRAILEGLVFRSASVARLEKTFPLKENQGNHVGPAQPISEDDREDAGTVALLFPPNNHQKWSIRRVYLTIKLWVLDWVNPASDQGASEKRVEKLMKAHDTTISNIKARYHINNLWYLEVVGVHPSLQARGLGGKAMSWILDYIKHEPIVLECTAEKNIPFYQNLGFKMVEEIELNDNDEAIKCWFMLWQAEWEGKCT